VSRYALALVFVVLGVPAAHGQTSNGHPLFVVGRVGGNIQSTDPGSGASVGAGGSFGVFFTAHWALDIEAWLPSYITDRVCPPRGPDFVPYKDASGGTHVDPPCEQGQFRDLLFGVNALRRFGGSGIHPYVLVGFVKSQIQNRTSVVRWEYGNAYLQGGGGVVFPLSSRLALAPEVRIGFGGLAAMVRPSVALVYGVR
jgi:hypothetical protein